MSCSRLQTPDSTATASPGYETSNGCLEKDEKAAVDNKEKEVFLETDEDPKNLPTWRRWLILMIICTASTCVVFDSSVVSIYCHYIPSLL